MSRSYLWKTKDGRVLKLSEMTNGHLNNAIAYAEKRLADARENAENVWMCAASCGPKTMAEYYISRYANDSDDEVGKWTVAVYALEKEKSKRVKALSQPEPTEYW